MAKSAACVTLLVILLGCALGSSAGPTVPTVPRVSKCFFVDGDCKPNPLALPAGAKGDAAKWIALLKGFQFCLGKIGTACSGQCVMNPEKGCTLTPEARKTYLGTLAPVFGACPAIVDPKVCAANLNCKVGALNKCVIGATGISNTFGLSKNYPAAVPILTLCKTMVAFPAKCRMTF